MKSVTAADDQKRETPARRAVLPGVLALVLYAVHSWAEVASGHTGNLLWACHLASVMIGAGLLFGSARLNAIGVLWLTMGVPLFLLDLAGGAELMPTSLLTHGGGVALGVYGVLRLGMPRGSWWRTPLLFFLLQRLCQVVTPVAENVNVSQAVWSGWERWFPSYRPYMAMLLVIGGVVFYGWERATQLA